MSTNITKAFMYPILLIGLLLIASGCSPSKGYNGLGATKTDYEKWASTNNITITEGTNPNTLLHIEGEGGSRMAVMNQFAQGRLNRITYIIAVNYPLVQGLEVLAIHRQKQTGYWAVEKLENSCLYIQTFTRQDLNIVLKETFGLAEIKNGTCSVFKMLEATGDLEAVAKYGRMGENSTRMTAQIPG